MLVIHFHDQTDIIISSSPNVYSKIMAASYLSGVASSLQDAASSTFSNLSEVANTVAESSGEMVKSGFGLEKLEALLTSFYSVLA